MLAGDFVETLPVVVFSTLIDTIDNKYKFFSFSFSYPLKINFKLKDNPEKLSLDLYDY